VIPKTEKVLVVQKDIEVTVTSTEPISITDWKQSAIEFIQNWRWSFTWEWYTDTCKWDSKQNSWWHWTRCKTRWTKVTKSQADKEFLSHLQPLYTLVDRESYTDNQKIAMVSYMYNVGKYAMNINTYVSRESHKDIRYIMWVYWYNKEFPWLKKRRKEELILFNL